jgi:hypothetical protein
LTHTRLIVILRFVLQGSLPACSRFQFLKEIRHFYPLVSFGIQIKGPAYTDPSLASARHTLFPSSHAGCSASV